MTFAMRDIFEKPVDRSIDGVIKADDEASLRVELDEYVITGEIGLRLGHLLEAYNNYSTANGVWISGFFGSGKSHLLKMLALLLENREVDGIKAFDIFAQKDELKNDPMLAGALRKAVSIPSKSILFNIDQKADVISKTDVDALLAVFQKVFDEMCGYYGKQPHIAQFERQLDERGKFDAFKAAFLELSSKPWETRGREEALLEARNIAAAFARATGTDAGDAKDILTQYRKDTRVSIEDFANTVKAWIDRQVPKFRLNFFVDEVGQYIADNVKLMTNLQTIAESLNTKCKGQAWIIVTAQQALTDVVGDMSARQENDFSKIQARFSNRMPLNSADVAEVIQKRLLAKTDAAEITLGNLHDKEVSNLRTLFDFADGSIPLKNYRDRNHFIASYPFPPYQYTLFQMAITSLSEHNAFEGKHSSVGERSMLAVFQEVAKALKDMPVGGLATFDRMFDGIQSVLKSSVQQSIHIAKDNLDDAYAFRVLKALFLVKYVKGFRATVRNISILLLAEFDVDQGEQRRRIEEALARLERETYIQRNGDVYEFLTNEEKDVEAEIKALDVDPAESTKALEDLAFDTILRHRKIKHLTTGYEYAFSRKLDDHLLGREYELSINIISPVGDDIAVPETVRMRNLGREELAVVLQPDVRFVRDLRLFRQTDKYIRQARTGSPQPGRDRIIQEKGDQNARRAKDLEARLRKLIADARLFVRGDELDIGGDEPQERIVKAFQSLVDKVYVNLPMLRGVTYQEADIAKAASLANDLLGDTGLKEEEQEVLNHIQGQARNGVKVSVKYLTERFGAKPYGWPTVASLCLTASLVAKGKCEARSDAAPLEGAGLARALNNSHQLGNILLTPQVEFLPSQIRAAKDLYRELFGQPADGSDARVLGGEWAESARKLADELNRLLSDKRNYPFLIALEPLWDRIADMTGKPPAWYITEPVKQVDALLNAKEDILDKIRSFMAGAQKEIYDDVRDFLQSQEANIGYVDAGAGEKLRAALHDPDCYKGNAVQSLKADLYALKNKVELDVLKERKAVIAAVDECAEKIAWTTEFQALDTEHQEKIRRSIETHKTGVEAVSMIPILRDRANGARTGLMQQILADIARLAPPPAAPKPTTSGMSEPPAPVIKPPTYINASQIKVAYPRTYLAEASDVEQYVNELRKTLLAEIAAGKKVIV
ncbi:BREX system P-loop protein BrxC [Rhizobium leguminosarum]|uniref:BREX system P-loop protein BrxC n=2 Tax=Rhizobium ruizarguesonis TaxID=2081791 RepID=UPI0010311E0A|nr:BREX system P-loop protein BrxC [Rhizobium ruizarguesonis]NEI14599.1 BREX system P-loop protein BrxC [Rhizobium ruizarguesonis]TAW76197.1 BREX system P-loop protein BrxC [Rhizobium ruizarguesonis]TAX13152.1 BREX system P-loop protein BrxC [Rhizobium ruizarguesonis]TAX17983.1 BREX system P-loop protein BrxC [Rhizobium ruizarguesonis]